MGYRALYREYRPQRFADIVGQEHITRTLQNAISSGRVSHAYLFCGPRGTGKTTTAKVLAKTLNCVNAPVEEPCNDCQNCTSTTEGNSVDVIEIDAASNRGIEDIRDLREKVKYSPAHGKYRIYIIDEVHMLTTEAFNALLKTLEEPPSHVIFVLATTEPHKVPVTILSRCQRFDFRRISVESIVTRLQQVADSAGLTVEEHALDLIAGAAEGGLRDALSILDQGAVYGNNKITVDDVHNLLGTVGEEVLSTMTDYLAQRNSAGALTLTNSLFQQGKDLRLLVKELSAYLRSLMLYLVSDKLDQSNPKSFEIFANSFKPKQISHFLEVLTKLEYDMKWSSQPKVLLELALVKMTSIEEEPDLILERLKNLEKHLHQITITGNLKTVSNDTDVRVESKKVVEKNQVSRDVNKPVATVATEEQHQVNKSNSGSSTKKIKQVWEKVLDRIKKLKPSVYGVFCEAVVVNAEDQMLTIGFKPQHSTFHKVRAEQSDNRQILEQALSDVLGGSWSTKIIAMENAIEYNDVKKNSEIEHPLVKMAIEMFGKDKVVVTNSNK